MGICNSKTSSTFTQEFKFSGNQYILKLKSEVHISEALEKMFQELNERLDLMISENAMLIVWKRLFQKLTILEKLRNT